MKPVLLGFNPSQLIIVPKSGHRGRRFHTLALWTYQERGGSVAGGGSLSVLRWVRGWSPVMSGQCGRLRLHTRNGSNCWATNLGFGHGWNSDLKLNNFSRNWRLQQRNFVKWRSLAAINGDGEGGRWFENGAAQWGGERAGDRGEEPGEKIKLKLQYFETENKLGSQFATGSEVSVSNLRPRFELRSPIFRDRKYLWSQFATASIPSVSKWRPTTKIQSQLETEIFFGLWILRPDMCPVSIWDQKFGPVSKFRDQPFSVAKRGLTWRPTFDMDSKSVAHWDHFLRSPKFGL